MKNQQGSSPLAVLLVGIIVLAIGGVGWFVLKAQSESDATNQAAQDASVSTVVQDSKSEASLKKFELKYEKISLSYPASLLLTDTSQAPDGAEPGTDSITLRADNNLEVGISTGLFGKGGACDSCKIAKSEKITTLGSSYYLNFVDMSGTGTVDVVVLAETPESYIGSVPGKNIRDDGTPRPMTVSIYINEQAGDGVRYKPTELAQLEALPEFSDAKKIIESLQW